MNPFYTHQEFLRKILDSFDYKKKIKCLEFGSGDGSSIIFNEYCKKYKNLTTSCYEHDVEWLASMKTKYELDNYSFNVVDWNTIDYTELKKQKYDLIFVDQGDWDARITTIDSLKECAKYIILHDYCYYNGFRGHEIPNNQKESALTIAPGSFFHNKYGSDFYISCETDLFPPTLILKSK
jgi:hypothetical protein